MVCIVVTVVGVRRDFIVLYNGCSCCRIGVVLWSEVATLVHVFELLDKHVLMMSLYWVKIFISVITLPYMALIYKPSYNTLVALPCIILQYKAYYNMLITILHII